MHLLHDQLADHLQEMLDGFADSLGIEESHLIGDVPILLIVPSRPAIDWLWRPSHGHSFGQINCNVVAEALLIQVGKWAPSKEPPEAI